MRLRPAFADDLPALATIHAASFDEGWTVQDLQDLCASPGALALVLEDDRPRGFILARLIAGESEILTVAVDPSARRGGLGRALVAAAMAQAEALGGELMLLEVAADNPAGQALYASLGFEQAAVRKDYYARPGGARIDAFLLRRTLNSGAP